MAPDLVGNCEENASEGWQAASNQQDQDWGAGVLTGPAEKLPVRELIPAR
jgi:hypothetical protein